MRLKIKLVIGITLVLIMMGLTFIIVNTFIRYQEEFGKTAYSYSEEVEKKSKKLYEIKLRKQFFYIANI